MKYSDPHEAFRPESQDVVEAGASRRKLPAWAFRIAAASVVAAVASGPVGYYLGYQAKNNQQTDVPVVTSELPQVDVYQSPPSVLRMPKLVGRVAARLEVVCAHYAYEFYPYVDDTPGFRVTDYLVYDNKRQVEGFVMADKIRLAWPVRQCRDQTQFIERLEASMPNVNHPNVPAPAVVIQ